MDAVTEFFTMGGYASYVWPSYGVFALVLGGLTLYGVRRNRAVREELERVENRRGGDR